LCKEKSKDKVRYEPKEIGEERKIQDTEDKETARNDQSEAKDKQYGANEETKEDSEFNKNRWKKHSDDRQKDEEAQQEKKSWNEKEVSEEERTIITQRKL